MFIKEAIMKDMTVFAIGETKHEMYFTIGDMRAIEREIGSSLIYLFSGDWRQLVRNIPIDVLVAGIRYGIHDEKHGRRTDDEAYDIIQGYCDDGNNLDAFTALFIQAIMKTGLFNPIQVKPKNAKAEKAKAGKSSAPSKTGSASPNP